MKDTVTIPAGDWLVQRVIWEGSYSAPETIIIRASSSVEIVASGAGRPELEDDDGPDFPIRVP